MTLAELNIKQEELRHDESNDTFEWLCRWNDLEYQIQLTLGKTKEEIRQKFFKKLRKLDAQLCSFVDSLESTDLSEYVEDSSVFFDDIDDINKQKIAISRVLNHRNII